MGKQTLSPHSNPLHTHVHAPSGIPAFQGILTQQLSDVNASDLQRPLAVRVRVAPSLATLLLAAYQLSQETWSIAKVSSTSASHVLGTH